KSAGSTLLEKMRTSRSSDVRIVALQTLKQLGDSSLGKAIQTALNDRDPALRVAALGLVPALDVPDARKVDLLSLVFQRRSIEDQQVALQALAEMPLEKTRPLLGRLTKQLRDGKLLPEVHLDLEETLSALEANDLLDQLPHLAEADNHEPTWEAYKVALNGGDAKKGARIFYRNAAAQCVRCHLIGDWGGEVGPELSAIGHELSREQLLQSLVAPSMRIAPGYGMVSLTLNDGTTISGVLKKETEEHIHLENGDQKEKVAKADVKERTALPSSMPNQGLLLSKRDIRDLVEFLSTLKPENS
ncbi:MAG: heme-binding protein, partial [Bacteroidota bacterium]